MAIAAPQKTSRRSRWEPAELPAQVRILAGRLLRALLREPKALMIDMLQPLVMLLLFSQVFASIANTDSFPPGVGYINYLMPAIMILTGISTSIQSGTGLIRDMENGIVARFRSLPVHNSAVLLARSVADLVRAGIQMLLLLIAALLLFGFSPEGGVLGLTEAYLLSLMVYWALIWVFLAIGSWLRNAQTMTSAGFLFMLPMMFASSAYVPIDGLPGWLQVIATVNPVTYAIEASRELVLDLPVSPAVVSAVLASSVLVVLGYLLALRGFRRAL